MTQIENECARIGSKLDGVGRRVYRRQLYVGEHKNLKSRVPQSWTLARKLESPRHLS